MALPIAFFFSDKFNHIHPFPVPRALTNRQSWTTHNVRTQRMWRVKNFETFIGRETRIESRISIEDQYHSKLDTRQSSLVTRLAFTLVELLVVIAIIGVLAALIISG